MNKKQEDLMKKLKKLQNRQKRAMRIGYVIMVFVTASVSWVIWSLLLTKIANVPDLTYWQGMVYTLLVYSTIFLTAGIVRAIQKGK